MQVSFDLRPTPPFRLDLTAWTLKRRAVNSIDRWDGTTYRRVLMLEDKPVLVSVTQLASPDRPRLRVVLAAPRVSPEIAAAARDSLRCMLGLPIDLSGFYRLAAHDPRLGPLAARFRGLKPPRFPTLFETLANAIACQQVSLSLGLSLLSRLAEHYAPSFQEGGETFHAFLRPIDLVSLEPDAFRELGFSYQKGRALIELARGIEDGSLDLTVLEDMDNGTAVEQLLELRGVGRWTAEYVLLRGLGRLDVFPGDDVGGRNNLERWLKLRKPLDYAGVRRVLARWNPYAGLVYFHLLLWSLSQTTPIESQT